MEEHSAAGVGSQPGGTAMPRDRQRLTCENEPKVDLAKLISSGSGRPGRHIQYVLDFGSGEAIQADLKLQEYGGLLQMSCVGAQETLPLVSSPTHFGGLQRYVNCPRSRRRARVLYKPLGAALFASRHAWGRRAAYASQFLDLVEGHVVGNL
jgi:hypothetical protein